MFLADWLRLQRADELNGIVFVHVQVTQQVREKALEVSELKAHLPLAREDKAKRLCS